jgi:hypothetical protein
MIDVLSYVLSYPVRSLPVRKQVARAGSCPDCGARLLTSPTCSNYVCRLDCEPLIEYRAPEPRKEREPADVE